MIRYYLRVYSTLMIVDFNISMYEIVVQLSEPPRHHPCPANALHPLSLFAQLHIHIFAISESDT